MISGSIFETTKLGKLFRGDILRAGIIKHSLALLWALLERGYYSREGLIWGNTVCNQLSKEGQVYSVQFIMANIEGSLVEFGKVAQLLCLEGPIEAVTSSDYANRPPLNYYRCAGTKSKCNIHRNRNGEKIKRAYFVSWGCLPLCFYLLHQH